MVPCGGCKHATVPMDVLCCVVAMWWPCTQLGGTVAMGVCWWYGGQGGITAAGCTVASEAPWWPWMHYSGISSLGAAPTAKPPTLGPPGEMGPNPCHTHR